MNRISKKLNCYVRVTGDASNDEDEGVQGFYLIAVTMPQPVQISSLTPSVKSAIATAVLDNFHAHQGIEDLDDFEISAFLSDGTEIEESDELPDPGLAIFASHFGSINESDVPFKIENPDIRVVDVLSTVERAESFIAGFEDDTSQKGVVELLADLRNSIEKLKAIANKYQSMMQKEEVADCCDYSEVIEMLGVQPS